ncbi:hypothetical protein [Aliivibrio fischeri]|uniref:hypothetical protein n=1 Tax=Aliivibrio fischeri TaxID=668 RepID=UPI001F16EE01|nr:hypothetical protein [Aliivibrio fischeri]MCE7556356.1 hypothetical protein [Aliivibrio fischeri]MCE7563081.1 hypothetical protein [Aliivibrio fischeri]MCE7571373.1 hypothetical protein [Aliivibrio fischeri]
MSIKFLYIDDDKTTDIQPFIDELIHFNELQLEIHHIQTRPMLDIKCQFLAGHYDGLIIDQKLDAANENDEIAGYWGTSLAQNFRTEMIGGEVPNSPIVLLSNEEVFLKYYDADESAHNLFDFTFGKTRVSRCTDYARKASNIIIGLAQAYKVARDEVFPLVETESKPFNLFKPLLEWDNEAFEYTDKRFIEHIYSRSNDIHSLVSLILNTLVRSAGILVTEEMLATKLGIDTNNSTDWDTLKVVLEPYKYKGAFSNLKERWWMSRIEDWWYEKYDGDQVLRALTAVKRVEAIRLFTSLENLMPITPKYSNGKQSEKYWVNCMISGTPLDPYDAVVIRKPDLMPWEQLLYLDPQITYDRQHREKYSVHPDYQKKVKPLYKRLTDNG